MDVPIPRHAEFFNGSFFQNGRTFRITGRCLTEDLGLAPDAKFEEIADHPILRAFAKDRATVPDGGKVVGSEAGSKTLRRLAHQDNHRGVTWWDRESDVVWLCAYHGHHRSGEDDDSFPYFNGLIAAGSIYPTADDFERLFEDEDTYFVTFIAEDVQFVLSTARENPETEIRAVLGGSIDVELVVVVVESLEETYIEFTANQLRGEHRSTLVVILQAFYPGVGWDSWENVGQLPTRARPERGKLCFRYLRA